MPRKPHSHHYIYKTTCKVTGRFYIGMHSTSKLEDGYLGSGKRLRSSIRKWGIENHTKEILEFLPDRSSLKEREKNLVNEDLLHDPMCMNLQIGGGGGFSNEEHKQKAQKAGGRKVLQILNNRHCDRLKYDEEYKSRWKRSIATSRIGKEGIPHSEETKRKIGLSNSISQKGEKNSQYGSFWITNGIENKKWKKDTIIPNGWYKGRKIK